MKILLCEDDSNIATIAKLSLEQIGKHQVTLATDGEQALRLGREEKFDLILLDEMMPKLSGVAVCSEFIKSPQKVAPVIFMSANPQEKRVEEFSLVAIGFIPKPFDPLSLNDQIIAIMHKKLKRAQ
ncbi:MAG: hypothetical protein A2Z20_04660 [Bdellovibrionales bacterium RBG_16_40_8]|nr:MAG: hypothetical protein A2Z20_04660 [Bdellovibrionales bacterium RBG_16_40_8]